MKPLFLFLAILLAMEPAVSVSCWMNGQCRLVCKDDEENVLRCPNRKRCCILSRYLTMEPVTIDGILPWTTPLPTRKPQRFIWPTQENNAVFGAVRSGNAVFCEVRCAVHGAQRRDRSEEFTPTCADSLPSSKRHILRCMGDKGICRTSCKKTEHPYFYCRDYRPCCLQSYMRINMFSTEDSSDWR